MNYLVMECHQSYAVVLDQEGRFLKAANLNYAVGQSLEQIIEIKTPQAKWSTINQYWRTTLATAACLVFMLVGSWYTLAMPHGIIRMKINPDVQMTVNRLNYVIDLKGLNEEGVLLTEGIQILGKKVDTLSDELADQAVELGYLSQGGQITLAVRGENVKWCEDTELRLKEELNSHFSEKVVILVVPYTEQVQPEQSQPEQAQPEQSQPEQSQPEQAQPDGSDTNHTESAETSVIIPVIPTEGKNNYSQSDYGETTESRGTDYGQTDYGQTDYGETTEIQESDYDHTEEDFSDREEEREKDSEYSNSSYDTSYE